MVEPLWRSILKRSLRRFFRVRARGYHRGINRLYKVGIIVDMINRSMIEVNFDGLVGSSHNYSGLASGNFASYNNKGRLSNPKEAALQGLRKMQFMDSLGLVQGVFPPQERPDLKTLRDLGFRGTDEQIIAKASVESPRVFKSCYSSSAMWAANCATISPASDTEDGKIHITPANLSSQFHRSLEASASGQFLKQIFRDPNYFVHHDPLPAVGYFGDEGAANHLRLCGHYGERALEVFVYGRRGQETESLARQSLAASKSIARLHRLSEDKTLFIEQNPQVIKEGVFHNDVISVNNLNVLFFHEKAFSNSDEKLATAQHMISGDTPLYLIKTLESEVPLSEAVATYLFNSQIISLSDGSMALVSPFECRDNANVHRYLQSVLAQDNPIKQLFFVDLRQSMNNGGGPACLRFRVVMDEHALSGVNPSVIFNDQLYGRLKLWVEKHFRDRLAPADLQDPALAVESWAALDHLTQILDLGSVYSFQK